MTIRMERLQCLATALADRGVAATLLHGQLSTAERNHVHTRLTGSYPDRTPTGKRRRAYEQTISRYVTASPPSCWAHESEAGEGCELRVYVEARHELEPWHDEDIHLAQW
ncbi:hypothetical protein GUY59_03805 [Nonomuraea sp. K271]|nr:hypothetical protein [Nonomuraea sp. K271]